MGGYSDEERLGDAEFYRKPKYPIWIEALKVFLIFVCFVMMIFYAAYDLSSGRMPAELAGGRLKDAGRGAYLFFAAGFLLMPVLSTILRRISRNIFIFLLPHVLFFVYIGMFSPHTILSAMGILYVIGLMVYGLARQMSREEEKELGFLTLFAAVLVMLILYGLSSYRGFHEYERILLGEGLIFMVLFFFYQHRVSLLTTLGAIDKGSNFSTDQVISFNTKVFFAYIALAVALFGGLYLLGLGDVLSLLGRWLLLLLRRLVRALARVEATPEAIEEEAQEQAQIQQSAGQMVTAGFRTGAVWVFLQKIVEIVAVIGLILLALWLIYWLIARFRSSYQYVGNGYEETRVSIAGASQDKVKRVRLSMFDRSPAGRSLL